MSIEEIQPGHRRNSFIYTGSSKMNKGILRLKNELFINQYNYGAITK